MSVDHWDLEENVRAWRAQVAQRPAIAGDAAELESHLRDRIDELAAAGLAPDEAFLIAVRRMGAVDDLSAEFAREHSARLWKQLLPPTPAPDAAVVPLPVALALAVAAGLLAKLAVVLGSTAHLTVLGRRLDQGLEAAVTSVVLVLAVLGALFVRRSRPPRRVTAVVAACFAVVLVLINVLPFAANGQTLVLAAVHAPVALWLALGVLYTGGDWRSGRARMEFIRFTGEWVAYYALIALGGGVLLALTTTLFGAVGMDASWFAMDWMLPCGAAGAVIVAAWLVGAKQSVIENIAPVLTKVFTPLVTALLVALLVIGAVQGDLVDADREVLILFDVTLILVLALLLYAMSARDPLAPAGWFDRLQLLLLGSALLVDVLVLAAMFTRIGAFGASANKVASLGLNLILLVNLAGAAYLQTRFLLRRAPFARLEGWQTSYVPVYLAWALCVVVLFPPVFQFR